MCSIKNKLVGRIINGYQWFCYHKGIYAFQKKTVNRYLIVECDENQLINGDIEYMTQHGLTIGKKLKNSIVKKYEKGNKS